MQMRSSGTILSKLCTHSIETVHDTKPFCRKKVPTGVLGARRLSTREHDLQRTHLFTLERSFKCVLRMH